MQAEVAGWKRANGSTWWPPYDGAIPGTQRMITLDPSQLGMPVHLIDRYGATDGTFVSPFGVPLHARALRSVPSQAPNIYRIDQGIHNVERSFISPWFGQRGLGIQYRLDQPVEYYLLNKQLGVP